MSLLKNITGKNYINGEFIEFGKQISVINPATLKEIATVPNLGLSEINSAINNTVTSFSLWSQSSFEARIAILRRWYNLVIANIEELSHILTLEQGKILVESKKEILYGASFIDWYTYAIHNIHSTIKPGNSKTHKIVTQYEPVGPSAAITPWNFPNAMITRKVVPAIAAGCSVILKPSSLTPLSALVLAKFASDAGLPAGVFNIITGSSDIIGKAFCEDFRLRKLSFTGSTNVGKILYQNAANTLKRLSLELGGNAPFIITADNNLEKVVSDLVIAKTRNSGQSCISPNRIFIEESIYEKFIEILKAKFTKLKAGDGFDKESDVGPLINSAAIEKIQKLLADAQSKGAKLICGGKVVDNFIEPTIIIDCLDNMDIFRIEIFGPVVACYKFKDLDEVIEHANNTEYGLQGYVYSNNISVAQMIASKLDFGMVSINDPLPANAKAPFAGRKASGFGVEGSFEGIFEYLNTKYINLQN
ncbi:NAD-dependent succinate-semialdehyde dehydrogenase [Rickettsia conorii subsp. heilongjiangensis]|uniref:NAD-dependent succinate-semialdehyde dehydrogenase n=1 Tax=Rickettsia conorii subsp. heilongjiangensis TaxID=226665 RepID=A0AAD1LSM5_RICCR|nr:NAD-dependent succinate-semialdehyde dehydrogenase [Rickettsia conorii]AEK74662.1 succinate semialdehyde dehydrogenase [Rickettsia conorii subsp. heilongjiangensis 054]BBM91424.1 NAD-dependent succinate-semialdehyde dehydrogenase [Rickettsia conorii subsp. heilongjiangensis]BBM92633.1 NAD-dependent succinate-semialdehyde dehydrogenase [Rickettsia conorii subsp. heilongjiangensis]BBM93842.1 NAD-dependent succinate-semialdehyde dehydrogenase [Rickettsia conorii subsp. heilongjiangensis]BBM950